MQIEGLHHQKKTTFSHKVVFHLEFHFIKRMVDPDAELRSLLHVGVLKVFTESFAYQTFTPVQVWH